MKVTNVFQVMTPIRGRIGDARWWPVVIVAKHDDDAIRVAEQAAMQLGFTFDGDIEVNLIRRAYTEDGL
jgi:hypothetical protein